MKFVLPWSGTRRRDALLVSLLRSLHEKVDTLMAKEQDLQNDIDQIKTLVTTKIDGLNAQIADLKKQVGEGTPVTQEQLDALDAEAKDIIAKLA